MNFSDKVEMEIFLNGELMAHKSEGTHKILNKWPSNGVLVIGQEQVFKVPRIKKRREWEMSHSGQCKNNLNFHGHYEAAEKIRQKSRSC